MAGDYSDVPKQVAEPLLVKNLLLTNIGSGVTAGDMAELKTNDIYKIN